MTVLKKPVEDLARFEIWNRGFSILMGDADIYQVLEHIEEALEHTDLGFGIVLQEGFSEGENKFLVYMHSENWEGHLTEEQLSACEDRGFTNSNDHMATEAILGYLGLSVIFSHFVKDGTEKQSQEEAPLQLEKGFLHEEVSETQAYEHICVSDGAIFVYQSQEGIKVLISDPYFDSSLYIERSKIDFSYDHKRVRAIGEEVFEENVKELAEYLTLFKDTLRSTQYARTTLSDQEIKECTEAIFHSDEYKKLNLDTAEEGEKKLFDLQCIEYQKRDEMYCVPFGADEPNWTPNQVIFDVSAKIIKPIQFKNPCAQEDFGKRYAGAAGETILMSESHFLYFQHNGFVDFANETKSGKAVSGAQMVLDGFKKCENDFYWTLAAEYVDNSVIAIDKDGMPHLFNRAGNDWFFYWKPLLHEGDKVVVSPAYGSQESVEVVVEETEFKDEKPVICYKNGDESGWAYFSQVEEIVELANYFSNK